MKKVLVVVDMQNDFIDGALGTAEAKAILPAVTEKIRAFDGDAIYVTYDTHDARYAETLEGRKLPVPHCIEGTPGHALHDAVRQALAGKDFREITKHTFGSFALAEAMKEQFPDEDPEIELCGLCTDICVVSNALLLRAAYPNAKMTVDAGCCAGVSPETHCAALSTMRCCQIDIIG